MVDREIIKEAIWQFVYMSFEKKISIKRHENGEMQWLGEKNLLGYDQDFEAHLKLATTEFYKKKAEIWSNTLSCNEYIIKVSNHIAKEEENADFFLQPESKLKIVNITLKETVQDKAEQLTQKESGCEYMFIERKID
jgi:hypothetical protein